MGVAMVLTLLLGACDGGEDAPATDQPPVATGAPEDAADAAAEEVATSFLQAYGAFDVQQAATYLADDAHLDLFGGGDWRLGNRFMEATGQEMLLDPCAVVSSTTVGTRVRCPFDYHALRSDEIGRGPFSGSSFYVTVLNGEIVSASMQLEYASNGFSEQMWEPFAKWVSETYPEDAAVMYADWPSQSLQRMTGESIRLWERHTRGYVEVVVG
jgi:hypothetical protein